MKIDVKELKKKVGNEATYLFEEVMEPVSITGDEAVFPDPLQVKAHLVNTGEGLLARVRVDGEALLHCSRCLEIFTFPLHVEFETQYREEGQGSPGKAEAEGLNLEYYHGDTVDLEDEVRENLFLAIPMKPVCREACPGLCPRCGRNRSLDGECGCENMEIDPRMASLKDLKLEE